jgi:CRP/FNR family cyclic AMP-dependent transcriptional regulator
VLLRGRRRVVCFRHKAGRKPCKDTSPTPRQVVRRQPGDTADNVERVIDVSLIEDTELFGALPADQIEAIAAQSMTRTVSRGDQVFAAGDEPTDLYVVVSGRIAIVNTSVDRRESMMALMEPGDLFGELPLFDGLSRSAGARALEPSEIVVIPYAPLRDLYRSQPELLWRVVNLLAQRLRTTDEALADTVFLDVTGRTAKRLLELSAGADTFVLPITQEELAGMVGASRERVNKAIASFVRLGWIELTDRQYRILDRVQLDRRSR